jgi:hypothetical protein
MSDDMPDLIFADCSGNIMEHPGFTMVGRSGDYFVPVASQDTIPLPKGSQLYVLPGRFPVGMDRDSGEVVALTENPHDGSAPVYAV